MEMKKLERTMNAKCNAKTKTSQKGKTVAALGKKLGGRDMQLLLLALPVVIYVFIFSYLPMAGVVLAFKDYYYADGVFGSPWVGFEYFKFFFQSDMAFHVTVNAVLYNLFFIVVGTVIFVAVALLLNEVVNAKAIKYYQTTMFFPYFLSWPVVAFILYVLISPSYGILNHVVEAMGMEPRNWYAEAGIWPVIICAFGVWKQMGMCVLLNYAVLIGIDRNYYEAAQIDGANKWQTTIHISLPFLVPITIIQFILSVGRIFNSDFGLFYQLTQGATILSTQTEVIDTYVYKLLMNSNDISMGAAVGLYQSVVGLVLVLLTNYIVSKVDSSNAMF